MKRASDIVVGDQYLGCTVTEVEVDEVSVHLRLEVIDPHWRKLAPISLWHLGIPRGRLVEVEA